MRAFLTLLAIAGLCSGCFVFEELDKGQAIMDAHSPKRNKEKREAASRPPPPPARPGREEPGLVDRARELWTDLTTPAPPEPDPENVIVRCDVHGNLQFSRKFDCVSKGGRVL